MATNRQVPGILLFAGFCLCLLNIWLPSYFLTGDGPSHVYNAQVVHDLWSGKNVAFYTRFYDLVYQPNPNWLSTLAIAALMFLVNGVVAEKIFLTLYAAIYICGFWQLLKKISGGTSYLVLMILFFVFPQTLAKGFYNFSFSIGFYFWVVWSWLRFLDKKSIDKALLFFLFCGLCFFTHLLAFGFAAFTCQALVVSYAWAASVESRAQKPIGYFVRFSLWLGLLLSPFLLLMGWFTKKEGGMQMHLKLHLYRLVELVQGKYLVNVTHPEDIIAQVVGMVMLTLLCCSFFRVKKFYLHKYDGLLISLAFVLFVYLCFPESFLGRLILISMRTQIFVYILITCCVAYRFPKGEMKWRDAFILLIVFAVFGVAQVIGLIIAQPGTLASTWSVNQMIAINVSLQVIVLAIIFCCVAGKLPFDKIKNGAFALLFVCFIAFTGVRLSCLLKASEAIADYTSAKSNIRPNSIVLPLDFAPCGKDQEGRMIADRNFLFYHASQYMGLDKPLIILDNYEANMGYFPLRWKDNVNPYFHLSKDEGIEAQPPYASINMYQQAGVTIDYVLMWCFDSSYLANEHFSELYAEINAGYHIVYTSATSRTKLYERN